MSIKRGKGDKTKKHVCGGPDALYLLVVLDINAKEQQVIMVKMVIMIILLMI